MTKRRERFLNFWRGGQYLSDTPPPLLTSSIIHGILSERRTLLRGIIWCWEKHLPASFTATFWLFVVSLGSSWACSLPGVSAELDHHASCDNGQIRCARTRTPVWSETGALADSAGRCWSWRCTPLSEISPATHNVEMITLDGRLNQKLWWPYCSAKPKAVGLTDYKNLVKYHKQIRRRQHIRLSKCTQCCGDFNCYFNIFSF